MNSVFATVVSERASMKHVNIDAHARPDTSPGQPIASIRGNTFRPFRTSSAIPTTAARKAERQNDASQPFVTDDARMSNPAMLHRLAQRIMVAMPTLC